MVGLYLFRHYLELALKFVIFHSHWLKNAQTNAQLSEIEDVRKTHSLQKLWTTAKAECQRLLSSQEWNKIEVGFIEKCVEEFESIDPNGEAFRYHGPKFGVEKDLPRQCNLMRTVDLGIDFEQLNHIIQHVHDVLNYLDTWLLETHGQNEEWEDILRSF